jgi:hypothetical protein
MQHLRSPAGKIRWPMHPRAGDSYLVLNSHEDEAGRIKHDVHFWLGSETSQVRRASFRARSGRQYAFREAPPGCLRGAAARL